MISKQSKMKQNVTVKNDKNDNKISGINKKLKLAMNSFQEFNSKNEKEENRKGTDSECIQINLMNLSPKKKEDDSFCFKPEELSFLKRASYKEGKLTFLVLFRSLLT